jgi:phosphoserine aminotransferase
LQEPYGRVFNFSAGPAVLPLPVLEEAQADLLSWKGSGISVMEMSHRGPEFSRIIEEAEADLRALLSIPDNYKVLFLQGGASQQFAAIPLNLSQPGDTVDYVSIPSSKCNFHEQAILRFQPPFHRSSQHIKSPRVIVLQS